MAKDSEDCDDTSAGGYPIPGPQGDRISDALKQAYDDVAQAPLPDKLAKLMKQLKDKGADESGR